MHRRGYSTNPKSWRYVMRTYTALLSLSGIFMVFFLSGGCKDSSTNPTSDQNTVLTSRDTVTISMNGNSFNPANPTISKHTSVIWYNNSGVTHTSTSYTNVWSTGDIAPGGSKSTLFDAIGTFSYHCIYHSGMAGTITVQ
jgi:plastocyanin